MLFVLSAYGQALTMQSDWLPFFTAHLVLYSADLEG